MARRRSRVRKPSKGDMVAEEAGSSLRSIPAVQTVLRAMGEVDDVPGVWRQEAVRDVLESLRKRVRAGSPVPPLEVLVDSARARSRELHRPHLRPVINATGVMIHTNLGRAPLPEAMMGHLAEVSTQYSTLEYRLEDGVRGSRHEHVEGLAAELAGAEAAMVVNNNAAAVLLALSAMAAGKEVVVSRGELVEIGGSFRIPEVMALSGARLVEVGATNKTHLYDYERAIGDETGLLLKVHQSNFRQIGFVDSVERAELCTLGRSRGIPVMEDLGSGVLLSVDLDGYHEPRVQDVVASGIDIVTFSGDKLLGGPQAGIIAGRREWIQRMKKHPLARAVRVDKMTLAVLESVLRWYREGRGAELPLWQMIHMPPENIRQRAERLTVELARRCPGLALDIEPDWSEIGGGSLPGTRIETYVIAISLGESQVTVLERALRQAPTAVIARVNRGKLMVDLRTVFRAQEDLLLETLAGAVHSIDAGKGKEGQS